MATEQKSPTRSGREGATIAGSCIGMGLLVVGATVTVASLLRGELNVSLGASVVSLTGVPVSVFSALLRN